MIDMRKNSLSEPTISNEVLNWVEFVKKDAMNACRQTGAVLG
ncbi:MAG: hypothetical protein ACI92S_005276 [Planctomycetaceae bacterium]|jgi:hypothetical protein